MNYSILAQYSSARHLKYLLYFKIQSIHVSILPISIIDQCLLMILCSPTAKHPTACSSLSSSAAGVGGFTALHCLFQTPAVPTFRCHSGQRCECRCASAAVAAASLCIMPQFGIACLACFSFFVLIIMGCSLLLTNFLFIVLILALGSSLTSQGCLRCGNQGRLYLPKV